MFRRKATSNTTPDARRTSVTGVSAHEPLDPTRVLAELLSRPSAEGVLDFGPREIPVLSNDPNRPGEGRLTIETGGGR